MNDHIEDRNFGSIVITPSEDTVFLWGQPCWGRDSVIQQPTGIIKVTLHKYGITTPVQPFGFIVQIARGGILRAFDWEVTQFSPIEGRKFQYLGLFKDHRVYRENEMAEMLNRTAVYGANEIWVNGRKARITGAYIYRDDHARGRTIFKFMMKRAGIPVCLMY